MHSRDVNSHTDQSLKKLLLDSFKRVDSDRSGFLQKHQLEDVLKKLTKGLSLEEPTPDDVDFIMKELDINGDGKLSKDEFMELINHVLEIIKGPQAEQKKG